MIKRSCLVCGKEFKTWPYLLRQGRRKYCSCRCLGIARRGENSPLWNRIEINCLVCGKKTWVVPSRKNRAKYCSYECYWKDKKGKHYSPKTEFTKGQSSWNKGLKFPERSGKNSVSWKGGEFLSAQGYVYVISPMHPNATKMGYVLRSHLVAEKCIGRILVKPEMIHHIGEKTDDRPEMLYLFPSRAEHNNYHFLKNKSELKSNLTKDFRGIY